MSYSDDLGDENMSRIVFGEITTPDDTEEIGRWNPYPDGQDRRLLKFRATYSNPVPDANGDLVPQEVRLMGLQTRDGCIEYSVWLNVTGLLMTNEAHLVRAAIIDVLEDADRNNAAQDNPER